MTITVGLEFYSYGKIESAYVIIKNSFIILLCLAKIRFNNICIAHPTISNVIGSSKPS